MRYAAEAPMEANLPSPPTARQRTCFVHAGTHKTGTTALQRVLCARADSFAAAGFYIPRSGRIDERSGHHNIAWELGGDARFDPARGGLTELTAELTQADMPAACISSEDFEYLHVRPYALRRLHAALAAAGFRTVAILYLRPQASYVESLYAELVKWGYSRTFDQFLHAGLSDGAVTMNGRWHFALDYEPLVTAFERAFGTANVVVRPYRCTPANDSHLRDFLAVLGHGRVPGALGRLGSAERLNAAATFASVVLRSEQNRSPAGSSVRTFELAWSAAYCSRFDPVGRLEARRIRARFTASNRRIALRYGIRLPCISLVDAVRDMLTALGLDPACSRRKRFLSLEERAVRRSARRRGAGPAIRARLARS